MSLIERIERIDFDKLNIKSHLNASLEEDGINVSEELIRRTLDAIRMHEANEPDAAKDIVDHKNLIRIQTCPYACYSCSSGSDIGCRSKCNQDAFTYEDKNGYGRI